ncbi:hypothetical protein R1sor_008374 [Riccia sorocarpa]|uniref:Ferredoxin n=1 Tax=Riccia sorocarpa TaxID=122646 RepID=A0ABD3HTE6_9MARC
MLWSFPSHTEGLRSLSHRFQRLLRLSCVSVFELLPQISFPLIDRIMAAALRRLAQVRFAHAAAAASASNVTRRSAPKVLDSTVKVTAISEVDGSRRALRGMLGQSLLRTLVRSGLIDGESHRTDDLTQCGAECQVSIANEWLEKLPPRSEDEIQILESAQPKGQSVDTHSRLSCQIILEPKLDGMAVAVPEPRPWKTN